jgi:hypothetical protein
VFAFRPTAASVIAIDPESVLLTAIGDTAKLRAVALDLSGDTIAGLAPLWRSSDPSVVTVDSEGLVTATGNGTASIIASFAGVADTTRIVVDQTAVDIVDLPVSLQLVEGETRIIAPRAVDANGTTIADADVTVTTSDPDVVAVDPAGRVLATGTGTATITAMVDGLTETIAVSVGPPATATVASIAATPPSTPPLSATGSIHSLLGFSVDVDGAEPVRITRLVFTVTGEDPAATLFVVRDENGNGIADTGETTVAGASVNIAAGTPTEVTLEPADMRVEGGAVQAFVIALRLSGAVPNGTVFQATWLPQRTSAIGTRSGALNRLELPASTVTSPAIAATVLGQEDILTFSENPVRSGRVIFNFREAPTVAAIYTVTGRLVSDLTRRIEDGGRIEWDLRNDDGERVAPGVYLVIFDVGGTVMRERLIVMPPGDEATPAAGADSASATRANHSNQPRSRARAQTPGRS